MLAKSVAPQKTSVPQAGSSLAFLSPFVPFVPGPKPDRAELSCYQVDTHLSAIFMRDICDEGMNQTIFGLSLTGFHPGCLCSGTVLS